MKLIRILNEAHADPAKLQKIADMIYSVCEGEVANQAADEGGTGFTGDAVEAKCDKVCAEIKKLVKARIAKENS